jgi:hypothetical protein
MLETQVRHLHFKFKRQVEQLLILVTEKVVIVVHIFVCEVYGGVLARKTKVFVSSTQVVKLKLNDSTINIRDKSRAAASKWRVELTGWWRRDQIFVLHSRSCPLLF